MVRVSPIAQTERALGSSTRRVDVVGAGVGTGVGTGVGADVGTGVGVGTPVGMLVGTGDGYHGAMPKVAE